MRQSVRDNDSDVNQLTAAIDKTRKMQFNSLNLRQRAEHFSDSRFVQRMQVLLDQAVDSLESLR